ncbi:MAG TPA: hypothetical protein VG826_25360 [Pirellulales bacterium]|nr:hypothetical protein [Pirellulales bacterium]
MTNFVETVPSQRRLVKLFAGAVAFVGALSLGAVAAATESKATESKATESKTGKKTPASRPAKPKVMPSFQAVKGAVSAQLTKNRYYKPGDVLSRKEIEPIFGELTSLGWKVEDRKAILDQLLPDDYYLIRALRSPTNNDFMRQVAQNADGYGYDRLDRISRMADGEVLVSRIMQEPGGWNFVHIMSETNQAPGMAFSFSMGPGGKDFMRPTGRIYTEEQFVARLKESYDKATKKTPSPKQPSAKKP